MESISNWQEIDLEMFKEIFNYHWAGKLKDKVLEVANLREYRKTGAYIPMFFGYKINIEDYPDSSPNKECLEKLKNIIHTDEFKRDYRMSSCVGFFGNISVTPLCMDFHYQFTMWGFFDGPIPEDKEKVSEEMLKLGQDPYWYYKAGREIVIPKKGKPEQIPSKKKYVLVRSMSYETWKYLMTNFNNYSKKGEFIFETMQTLPDRFSIREM